MEASDLTKAEAVQKYNYARNLLRKTKEKAAEGMKVMKTAVETGGAALVLGYWHGATMADNPDFEQFGLPADLAIAFACHGLAFAGVAKSADEDLHAIGNGALAFYAARTGIAMGVESTEDDDEEAEEEAQEAAVAGVGARRFSRSRRPANPYGQRYRAAA